MSEVAYSGSASLAATATVVGPSRGENSADGRALKKQRLPINRHAASATQRSARPPVFVFGRTGARPVLVAADRSRPARVGGGAEEGGTEEELGVGGVDERFVADDGADEFFAQEAVEAVAVAELVALGGLVEHGGGDAHECAKVS